MSSGPFHPLFCCTPAALRHKLLRSLGPNDPSGIQHPFISQSLNTVTNYIFVFMFVFKMMKEMLLQSSDTKEINHSWWWVFVCRWWTRFHVTLQRWKKRLSSLCRLLLRKVIEHLCFVYKSRESAMLRRRIYSNNEMCFCQTKTFIKST